jgi:hypothetical protein
LEAVLTGRSSPEDPEVAQRLRQDPRFAQRLAELGALQGRLDRALQEQRALEFKPELAAEEQRFKALAHARLGREMAAPGSSLAEPAQRPSGPRAAPPGKPKLLLLGSLVSAAAALLFYFRPWQPAADPDLSGLSGISLGQDSAIEVTELRLEASGLVRLEANWPETPGCTYRVRIIERTAAGSEVPLLELELSEPNLLVAALAWPPTAKTLELTVESLPPGALSGEVERLSLQRPSPPN